MITIILVAAIVWALYLYLTSTYDYWAKKGVKHNKPLPLVGNFGRVFLQTQSMSEFFDEQYNQFPGEKIVGYFNGRRRGVVLRDPVLIKHVIQIDFNKFYLRAVNPDTKGIEPMLKGIFFADGDLWKLLRQRITPAFSSGKLKAMFPLIVQMTERLQSNARVKASHGSEVDARNLMARYTTDFIGACGFGLDSDSFNDDSSTFRKLGKRIFTFNTRDAIVTLLKMTIPELFKSLYLLSPEIERNTVALTKGIMRLRNYKPSGRHDFVDLLLESKMKGKIVGESIERKKADGTPETAELELDDLLMAAQVFNFFTAGFETSSVATSCTLHQLAFHPEAQRRCQQEVDEVLSRHDGKLCYDAVKEMKYLEMCLKESMRIFPSVGYLLRSSAEKYQFPSTDVTIDEGVTVAIPIQAIINDPQYFEEPEKFIPERFSPENAKNIPEYTYMPFGSGPRACVGGRLALLQSLAGLAALLRIITVSPSKNSPRKLVIDHTSNITQAPKGGVPLTFNLRT